MADSEAYSEQKVRDELACLLVAAVSSSGKTRGAIARDAGLHKDSFRRVLAGERSASLGEVSRILHATGANPRTAIAIFLLNSADRASSWLDTDIGLFLEQFLEELPSALERVLGNQLQEVRPRWAKGTAQRVARLLSDHIEDLERKDALYLAEP